ncbi:MAG: hypothetical protein P4L57_08060 [Rhizomicrobium sp.]|nr:hypothetical protein [Rhizomicrobium sp.]
MTFWNLLLLFVLAAVVAFFVVSFVLARDDGAFALAIRLAEILLPFAAAIALSGFFLKGMGPDYFPAACCFGLAVAIALLRRLPSLLFTRPPEGAYVFAYTAATVAGLALAIAAAFPLAIG